MSKRSGPSLTDASRAARGIGRFSPRLTFEALERLSEIARAWGVSRTAALTALIMQAEVRKD